jgi:SNF2 family DNA or RNA helicase
MGLGKTVQLLSLLQYAKEHPDAETPAPSLVICPTSVADNWLDEAAKFTPDLTILRYGGANRAEALAARPDVLVTTYETLRRDMGVLQNQAWDYVILDEAQKVKNPITDTARACRQLLARHRLAVTGTPIENKLDELWALFDFLMPGYLGSQARFKRDFDGPITRDNNAAAAEELKRKIAPFVLRRMKEQVATDLPPKIYVARECKLTREQSQLYAKVAGEGRERIMEQARKGGNNVTLTMSILAALTHLKQICCHPALLEAGAISKDIDGRSGKFELFKDVLAERLEAGDKVLVFSQYAEMCKIIARYLDEEGIPSLYLDGQTRNRQELVRQFQTDPNIKVFVLSLRAAGFGITLTAASSVIHYDRWWNPAVENQATDRAYRIGQHRAVQVIQFRTLDTIEEKIDKVLTRKSELFGDVIDEDLNGKSVTRDELLELFTFSPLQESATQEGLPVITAATPAPVGAR